MDRPKSSCNYKSPQIRQIFLWYVLKAQDVTSYLPLLPEDLAGADRVIDAIV
jgi:hypothetical protein